MFIFSHLFLFGDFKISKSDQIHQSTQPCLSDLFPHVSPLLIAAVALLALAGISFAVYKLWHRNNRIRYYVLPLAILLAALTVVAILPAVVSQEPVSSICEGPEQSPFDDSNYDTDPVEGAGIQDGIRAGKKLRARVLSGSSSSPESEQVEMAALYEANLRENYTVRYDPQTADEQVFSVCVNADTLVRSYFLPGYDLFLDAQGQNRLETFEGEGDLVIYAIPKADGQSEFERKNG